MNKIAHQPTEDDTNTAATDPAGHLLSKPEFVHGLMGLWWTANGGRNLSDADLARLLAAVGPVADVPPARAVLAQIRVEVARRQRLQQQIARLRAVTAQATAFLAAADGEQTGGAE